MEKFNHNEDTITGAVGYNSVEELKEAVKVATDKLASEAPLTYEDKKAIATFCTMVDGELAGSFLAEEGNKEVIGDKESGSASEIIELILKSNISDDAYDTLFLTIILSSMIGDN